jgi:hypothetical protein
MSILTDLMQKKITFSQAATQAGEWVSQIVAKDPTLQATAATVLSDVKQAASNAVNLAESALDSAILPAAASVEAAFEAALAKATGGVSLPFNPIITHGIDTIAAALKAEVDAAALKAKANLAK